MDPVEALLQALIVLETGKLVKPGSEWVTAILKAAETDIARGLDECAALAAADVSVEGELSSQGREAFALCADALEDMGFVTYENWREKGIEYLESLR